MNILNTMGSVYCLVGPPLRFLSSFNFCNINYLFMYLFMYLFYFFGDTSFIELLFNLKQNKGYVCK